MCDCNPFEFDYDFLSEMESFKFDNFNDIFLIEANKTPKLLKQKDMERSTRNYQTRTNPASGKMRLQRGDNSKLMKYDFDQKTAKEKFGNQYGMIVYNVKSSENSEGKADGQHGYIVYNKANKNIKQVWCSCSDFYWRLWAPYASAGFSTFDIDKKFEKWAKKGHTQEWTNETNPEGTLFLCKHLYRAMTDVLDMNNIEKIALARDTSLTQEEQELRSTIEKDIRQQGTGEEKTPEPTKPVPQEEPAPVIPVEPTPAEQKSEPEQKVVVPVKPKPVAKSKPEQKVPMQKKKIPSTFEKEYDKFVDDLEQEEEAELKAYEEKKKSQSKEDTNAL